MSDEEEDDDGCDIFADSEKEEEDEERVHMLLAHVSNKRGSQAENGSCLMTES